MSLEHPPVPTSTGEATGPAADRRRFPRMHLDHPVSCEVGGETIVARALSISGDGMLFEADRYVAPGTVVEVRIGPPLTLNQPFRARMTIARVEEVRGCAPPRHRVAGRFSKVI